MEYRYIMDFIPENINAILVFIFENCCSEIVIAVFAALAQQESENMSSRVEFGKRQNGKKGLSSFFPEINL